MLPCRGRSEMRLLLAGATGAIGRPLIRGLKQSRHSVFCLVRSAESTGLLAEMGAEAFIGDALDAASVQSAIARVRPDAVINELTSLPQHYTPAEMKAAAERDSRIRREGNVNLLAGMRESGVRRYVLQSSGFWYAPGEGLADESSPLAVDASPGVAASARTYIELESTACRESPERIRSAKWSSLSVPKAFCADLRSGLQPYEESSSWGTNS